MDTYADDLATLVAALDLRDAIHVGHSTGGGEVARYLGRHGTDARRQGRADQRGAAADAEDAGKSRRPADRSLRPDPRRRAGRSLAVLQGPDDAVLRRQPSRAPSVSQGVRDSFWLQGMQAGHKSALDCIKAFSETDFTEDLEQVRRADADHARRRRPDRADWRVGAAVVASWCSGATLKVYPGFSHGMCTVNKDQINADLLAFIRS